MHVVLCFFFVLHRLCVRLCMWSQFVFISLSFANNFYRLDKSDNRSSKNVCQTWQTKKRNTNNNKMRQQQEEEEKNHLRMTNKVLNWPTRINKFALNKFDCFCYNDIFVFFQFTFLLLLFLFFRISNVNSSATQMVKHEHFQTGQNIKIKIRY